MPGSRHLARVVLGLFAAMALWGVSAAAAATAHAAPLAAPALTCHIHGVLPDPSCQPGATNPDVTPSTIHSTICVSGWTSTVRPPTSYTNPLKVEQIGEYGYGDTSTADYEEDHLLSGGRVPLPVPASSPGVSGMPLADVVPRMG